MNISWGNWDVRIYAAGAWVSLAARFAAEHPVIVDHIEAALADPVPAVRLQAAQNLQVLCVAAPERMWTMIERLADHEPDTEIVASFLSRAMRRLSHSNPDRCETVLSTIKERLHGDLGSTALGRDLVQAALGSWTAQLYVGQGRALALTWLKEWAAEPGRYGDLLDSFSSSLREEFSCGYDITDVEDCGTRARARQGLAVILGAATAVSADAYGRLASNMTEAERQAAIQQYQAAEKVIHHATNQLYFGCGAYKNNGDGESDPPDVAFLQRFLSDHAEILSLLALAREPSTLHQLLELYEFLIPGDPIRVFETIQSLLLGHGKEEGYHFESLGQKAVVQIVRRYIADHRAIFDDDGRRARLVEVLRLFSDVGWPDALRLLYSLPDLLR